MRARWRNWRSASRSALVGGRAPGHWQRQLARRVSRWAPLRNAESNFAALLTPPFALREGPLEGAQLGPLTAIAARQTEASPAPPSPRRLDLAPKTPRQQPGDLLPALQPQPAARAPEREKPPPSAMRRAWAAAWARQESAPPAFHPADAKSARLPPETERGAAAAPRLPSLPPTHIPAETLKPLLQRLAGATAHSLPELPSRASPRPGDVIMPPPLPPNAAQRTWLAALEQRLKRALHAQEAIPSGAVAPPPIANLAPPERHLAPWALPFLDDGIPEALLWQLAEREIASSPESGVMASPPAGKASSPAIEAEIAAAKALASAPPEMGAGLAPPSSRWLETAAIPKTMPAPTAPAAAQPAAAQPSAPQPLAPAPPSLPPLAPAQQREALAFPAGAITVLQGARQESALTEPEDLGALAEKIRRILEEEARRHGIDV